MDIIRFVNSPEVQAHLKEIGYQPDLYAATWLVHHSRQVLLSEKLKALGALPHHYPDMTLPDGRSLGSLIKEHVREKETALERFFTGDADSLYTVQIYHDEERSFCDVGGIYTSFEALRHLLADNEGVTIFRVSRYHKDCDEGCDSVDLWENGEVRDVFFPSTELDDLLFYEAPPMIPTPYRPGDLVTTYSGKYAVHSNHRYEVGVLAEAPTQYRAIAYIVDAEGEAEHLGFGCDMVRVTESELGAKERATLRKIGRETHNG